MRDLRSSYTLIQDLRERTLEIGGFSLNSDPTYIIFTGKIDGLVAYINELLGESYLTLHGEGHSWAGVNDRHGAFWNLATDRIVLWLSNTGENLISQWAAMERRA